jgi:DNA repair protein RecN (Recombination protein N)
MINLLRIKNLALAADITLELESGFNVISGETGAGKSVIIGALNLALGERADREMIRSGEQECVVEAVIEPPAHLVARISEFLADRGLEPMEGEQLFLKRSINKKGSNRQFINGSPTNLSTLVSIGDWLIDMHGPHDHQSLLKPAEQLAILDAYGDCGALRSEFSELVQQRARLRAEKQALIQDERAYAGQLDLLSFQIKEIESAKLSTEEEETLHEEYERASNASSLIETSQHALGALEDDDSGALVRLGQAGKALQELARLDPKGAGHLVELHFQVSSLMSDLVGEVMGYLDPIDIDPARLNEMEGRIHLIQGLKRKYGKDVQSVLDYGASVRERLRKIESKDEEAQKIDDQIAQLDLKIWDLGEKLSRKRSQVIPKLSKDVSRHLKDLGFARSHFEIELITQTPKDPGKSFQPTGLDTIEFQFAPNIGEPARPLRLIASSGEMARVMLALKTALAAQDQCPTLIFDEIDANVGGETAHAVADKMKLIGKSRQTLCITHLPAVAAAAGRHYLVSKSIKKGRTISEIRPLTQEERVEEITRMLGGGADAARIHAEALLKGH